MTREYLEQWLRDDVEGRVEPSTGAIYRYDVRHYLIPRVGDVPVTRLSAQIIQSCLNRMIEEGLSAATVHQVFRVLRTALATAVRWGLLARNPCEFVKRPRIGMRATKPIWGEEEARLFLAEARRSSPYYRLFLTILLTGLRPGEALALRWDDVDLTFARTTVRQKFYRLGRQEIWGETKTHKENHVAMPALLVEELRALREEQAKERRSLGGAYEDRRLVFCQVNGKPLHAHDISQRDFLGVLTRAKLKRIRLYDLRHLHATYFADLAPAHVLKDRLGHSSEQVALRYYVHHRSELQRGPANVLAERLLAPDPKAGGSRE